MKKVCILLVLITYSTSLLSTLAQWILNFCGPRNCKMKFVTPMDNLSLTTTSIIENGLSVTRNSHWSSLILYPRPPSCTG